MKFFNKNIKGYVIFLVLLTCVGFIFGLARINPIFAQNENIIPCPGDICSLNDIIKVLGQLVQPAVLLGLVGLESAQIGKIAINPNNVDWENARIKIIGGVVAMAIVGFGPTVAEILFGSLFG